MSDGYLRIYQTQDAIAIHNVRKTDFLLLEKEYLSINMQDSNYLTSLNIVKAEKTFGVLGIITIGIFEFLIHVPCAKLIGNIGNTEIFEIIETEFLQISSLSENYKTRSEIVTIVNELKNIFKQGFYFSNNFDLTNSLQNQKNKKIINNNSYDIIRDANQTYMWNYDLFQKFFDYNIDSEYMVNLIWGYVDIKHEKYGGVDFQYILISRRSTMNSGVKSLKRGVDQNGHSANHVETEQIMICNSNVFSFVQIRANPPVFYNKFQKKSETLSDIFEKHVQNILTIGNYKLIFVINLMNKFREKEQSLTDIYEQIIMQKDYKFLKYSYFDYEYEMKNFSQKKEIDNLITFGENTKMDSPIECFMSKIEEVLKIFKFFGIYYNIEKSDDNTEFKKRYIIDQVGIIRTSCYDSLERTNKVQKQIAWKMLLEQLELIGIQTSILGNEQDINEEHGSLPYSQNLLDNISSDLNLISLDDILSIVTKKSNFAKTFKTIWDNNGMMLSLQYRGKNEPNSYSEYIVSDSLKQRCIDILLKKYQISMTSG